MPRQKESTCTSDVYKIQLGEVEEIICDDPARLSTSLGHKYKNRARVFVKAMALNVGLWRFVAVTGLLGATLVVNGT